MAARDHCVEDGPMPWGLDMFYDCHLFGQFPKAGGCHDQDDSEMYLMKLTKRAVDIYSKQDRGETLDEHDAKFVVWLEREETDGRD